jgi:hypothetical protein
MFGASLVANRARALRSNQLVVSSGGSANLANRTYGRSANSLIRYCCKPFFFAQFTINLVQAADRRLARVSLADTTPGGSAAESSNLSRFSSPRVAALAPVRSSLDHLVGAGEQLRWQVEAECPGGLHIDNELVFGRRLHRTHAPRKFGRVQQSKSEIGQQHAGG